MWPDDRVGKRGLSFPAGLASTSMYPPFLSRVCRRGSALRPGAIRATARRRRCDPVRDYWSPAPAMGVPYRSQDPLCIDGYGVVQDIPPQSCNRRNSSGKTPKVKSLNGYRCTSRRKEPISRTTVRSQRPPGVPSSAGSAVLQGSVDPVRVYLGAVVLPHESGALAERILKAGEVQAALQFEEDIADGRRRPLPPGAGPEETIRTPARRARPLPGAIGNPRVQRRWAGDTGGAAGHRGGTGSLAVLPLESGGRGSTSPRWTSRRWPFVRELPEAVGYDAGHLREPGSGRVSTAND